MIDWNAVLSGKNNIRLDCMRIHPFRALYPNTEAIASFPAYFNQVKEGYLLYLDFGVFKRCAYPAFYIYQIEQDGKQFSGLITSIALQDFFEGKIKKHEGTVLKKEEMQIQLLLQRQAAVKPVLMTYPKVEQISDLLRNQIAEISPFLTFSLESDQSIHRFWAIEKKEIIHQIQSLFEAHVDKCYIADGHHRTVANAVVAENDKYTPHYQRFGQLFAALFSTDAMEIQSFYRVVQMGPQADTKAFIADLQNYCSILPISDGNHPIAPSELIMLIDQRVFLLKWNPDVDELLGPHQSNTDADLLNELIIGRMMGIGDVRKDRRISYLEPTFPLANLRQHVMKTPGMIAFCLHPLEVNELIEIVDKGQVLPPKTTWFKPRLMNGMLIRQY